MKGKKVFVGLSGGVDSSVSAALLLRAGAHVTGVFIKGWYPDFLNCDWKEERRDAMRVAAHLGIPFLTCDAEESYKQHVIDYMVSEYKAGRTPNPDVMCNKYVKFGTFFDFAMERGADYIATGHYARSIENRKEKRVNSHNSEGCLLKGVDVNKDQSYFLWAVPKAQLEKTLFPIGDFDKKDVRKLASKFKLFTSEKKDSQGLCFLGKVDLDEFLSHYIPHKEGKVLNEKGEEVGVHNGVHLYTLGERHGFTIIKKGTEDKPYYIISKDISANTITISDSKKDVKNTTASYVVLRDVNWIKEPKIGIKYQCRWRYRQELFTCEIEKKADKFEIKFDDKHMFIPLGQSLVVYLDDECVGGGIVELVK